MTKKLIKKVTSIGELHGLAQSDPRYAKLALLAAANLGGRIDTSKVDSEAEVNKAIHWLRVNADETGSTAGVVKEINFVRDAV